MGINGSMHSSIDSPPSVLSDLVCRSINLNSFVNTAYANIYKHHLVR